MIKLRYFEFKKKNFLVLCYRKNILLFWIISLANAINTKDCNQTLTTHIISSCKILTNLKECVSDEYNITLFNSNQNISILKCNLEDTIVSTIPFSLLTKNELHGADFSYFHLIKIRSMDIYGNKLIYLNLSHNHINGLNEKNIFSAAYNLYSIDLSYNKIAYIHQNALSNTYLKVLLLSFNNIEYINPSTFNNLVKLEILKLNNNLIQEVDFKIFPESLNSLTLNTNNIHRIVNFDSVKILQMYQFNITHNPIEIIPNDLFKILQLKFPNKTMLSMDNMIYALDASKSQLDTVDLQRAYNLTNLNLSSNHLQNIEFHNTSNLKQIDLSSNNIKEISFSASLPNLIELNLANNNLASIKNLTNLTELLMLDLSFNKIMDIDLMSFSNMNNLKILNLEMCGLTKINFGTFSHQHNLEIFDISYNNLETIDWNMFASLTKVKELFVDGNKLKDLQIDDIIECMPRIMKIGISDNEWNCTVLASIIKQLNAKNVQVFVDHKFVIRNVSNVKGIACTESLDKNIIESIATLRYNSKSNDHVEYLKEIEQNIFNYLNGTKSIGQTQNTINEIVLLKTLVYIALGICLLLFIAIVCYFIIGFIKNRFYKKHDRCDLIEME